MARDLYVLGLNAWDHDVSVCLLRNGEIAVAIEKERVTRLKHASGYCDSAVQYCLDAEGIDLDRVDLIVRNCYLMPVPELERMLDCRHLPYHFSRRERARAQGSELFRHEDDDRFITCSHHLAHAYSAFAASPFERGAVMIVDGVGGYRRDAETWEYVHWFFPDGLDLDAFMAGFAPPRGVLDEVAPTLEEHLEPALVIALDPAAITGKRGASTKGAPKRAISGVGARRRRRVPGG